METQLVCSRGGLISQRQGKVTIDTLPDYVLLQTFSFCREVYVSCPKWWNPMWTIMWWRSLVHVCRRWRQIVFSSPRTLHLMISCDFRAEIRNSFNLNIWPPFLISVHHEAYYPNEDCEDTIAALELRDRVSDIQVLIDCHATEASAVSQRVTAAMLEPFPELSYLHLKYRGVTTPVLPDAFLGGFAPSLQNLELINVAFPALCALLLSTTRLTVLHLRDTPYISPEAMVTCLVALPNFEHLGIEFQEYPDRTNSSSLTRAILPSLISFQFNGIGEYSEKLLARIDAPILQTLSIKFFDVIFRIPQLHRFLSCAQEFEPPNGVVVEFGYWRTNFKFIRENNFKLSIDNNGFDFIGQVSSQAAICRELSPLLSRVERLDLDGKHLPRFLFSPNDMVSASPDWIGLFYPFTAVQSLSVCKILGPLVAPALGGLTIEGATAVLPKLRTLFLEELEPSGSEREAIEAFIATRSLSDHPVVLQQGLCPDSDAEATISP